MTIATRRDLAAVVPVVRTWLARRVGDPACTVSGFSLPKAGYSNETIFFRATWTEANGSAVDRRLVLRIEPTTHRLFAASNALLQAETMMSLAGMPGVPVPVVVLVEPDRGPLGAPFFIMERVAGRIPSDVPSWHRKGWVVDLEPADRMRVHDNGLAALVALHAVSPRPALDRLAPADGRPPLVRIAENLTKLYDLALPVLHHDPDVLAAGLEYVQRCLPDDTEEVVVWGDARPGNMIYGPELEVVAMLDWEGATIGPRGIDLGWWVVFDEFLCEAKGLPRLVGVPGRDDTVSRYQQLAGVTVPDVGYYEVLAALQLALLNSRLSSLLVESGLDPARAAEYTTRTTGILRRRLDLVHH